jgi:hypothetical protein
MTREENSHYQIKALNSLNINKAKKLQPNMLTAKSKEQIVIVTLTVAYK